MRGEEPPLFESIPKLVDVGASAICDAASWVEDHVPVLPVDDAVTLGSHKAAAAPLLDKHSPIGEYSNRAVRQENSCFKLVRLWVAEVIDPHLPILTVEFTLLDSEQKVILYRI